MVNRRHIIVSLPAAIGTLGLSAGASAQGAKVYPSAPVKIVVPYPAGGAADFVGRVLAEKLSANWSATLVENRAGADGIVGANAVFSAAPDGHTVLLAAFSFPTLPLLSQDLKWSHKSFVPVGMVAVGPPNVIVVSPNSQFKTLRELVAYAKDNPGKLNVAGTSGGSAPQLGLELLAYAAKIDLYQIAYPGAPQMAMAVMQGDAALTMMGVPAAVAQLKAGRLKALAVVATSRSKSMPDVPTIAEAGFPEALMLPWYGLLAPPETPREVVAQLNRELNKALTAPDLSSRLNGVDAEVASGTPEALAKHLDDQTELVRTLLSRRKR